MTSNSINGRRFDVAIVHALSVLLDARNERAISAEDVLLRRSKRRIHLTAAEREAVRIAMGE